MPERIATEAEEAKGMKKSENKKRGGGRKLLALLLVFAMMGPTLNGCDMGALLKAIGGLLTGLGGALGSPKGGTAPAGRTAPRPPTAPRPGTPGPLRGV